jgi:ABC-2 type transport system ATP-binding protein
MELSGLIRSLRDAGMTLIISSHILAELEQYSTHMLTMRGGQITGPHPVGGTGMAGGERLKVSFTGDAVPIIAFLQTLAGIANIRDEGDGVSFDHGGGETERPALLRAMIDAGLPVMSFTVAGADLERLYRAGDGR